MTEEPSARGSGRWQFWIDRGGTFTDVVARAPDGALSTCKLLSDNPDHYADAAIEGIRRALGLERGAPIPAERIGAVKMGTTVATNALLERRGAKVVLVTTEGFADALRIAYQNRPDLFALDIRLPDLLHARTVEVAGRIRADGAEIAALDLDAARAGLEAAFADGFRSCAILFMHAWRFPDHERAVAALAREVGFSQVSASHEVSPLMRLVGRGDTTVADAYLTPILRSYVDEVAGALAGARLMFMQSNGGLTDARRFQGRDAVLSGPAGGIVGAAATAEAAGLRRIIAFDMGGTSTDVAHYDGAYERSFESEVAGVRLRAPMMRIHTVAAGGGSVLHFRGGRFQVGPDSAGADPGPACYRKGGPLTVTDANLLLGRIRPEYFPAVFGPNADQPLDADVVRRRFAALARRVNDETGTDMAAEEVAEGFLRIAVDNMAAAIKRISTERGFNVTRYALAAFGGAGGQHACRVADALGMEMVFVHPLAGVLSALGMGLADIRELAEAAVEKPLGPGLEPEIAASLDRLAAEAEAALSAQGVAAKDIRIERRAHLRYLGTDTALIVPAGPAEDMARAFADAHRRRFGFTTPEIGLICEAVSVEAVGGSGVRAEDLESMPASGPTRALGTVDMVIDGASRPAPVYGRAALVRGAGIAGPALIMEEGATTVIEPGWSGTIEEGGALMLRRTEARPAPAASGTAADPVMLEVFNNLFMSIAEEMGAALVNTAHSVNIKERLDFSCAVFDGEGSLIANAPHMPVHLGSMADAVKAILRYASDSAPEAKPRDSTTNQGLPGGHTGSAGSAGSAIPMREGGVAGGLRPGDAFIHNAPYDGGTHLPDVTVIRPVFIGEGEAPLLFVAARGHHADLGGTHPGSMPPASKTIDEEGVLFEAEPMIRDGHFREDAIRARLGAGPYPARNPDQNVADLKAQAAACARGEAALGRMVADFGLDVVRAYMGHVQDNAEEAVRRVVARLADGAFTVAMDDGSEVHADIRIDRDARTARVDFTGTSGPSPTNFNAPRAVCRAAVLYVFRALVDEPIPMNDGCLRPIEIVIPDGCLLAPHHPAAVVAGNVETSQCIVDALLGAVERLAASQGTMNNLTFGDAEHQYYETICGGAGAGPGFDGASAVHTHMTNSRLTDPEVLEWRFPVLLERFAIRRGSGGAGRNRGGDGVIRRIRFLAPMTAAILSNRRATRPFGLAGGDEGAAGINRVERADGTVEVLGATAEISVAPGDAIVIETPGGGGFGRPGNGPGAPRRRP